MFSLSLDSLPRSAINLTLQEHAEAVMKAEQELLKERLQRKQRKEAKIKAIETSFDQQRRIKEDALKDKACKIEKNKEAHLKKIAKRCQEHDKAISKKLKDHQSRRRASLREAWAKAEKFNSNILQYQSSKSAMKQNIVTKGSENEETDSKQLPEDELEHQEAKQQIYVDKNGSAVHNRNKGNQTSHAHNISSANAANALNAANAVNASNAANVTNANGYNLCRVHVLSPSVFIPMPKRSKWNMHNHSKDKLMRASMYQSKNGKSLKSEQDLDRSIQQTQCGKLDDALKRFRKHLEDSEAAKIQEMGEKLERIEKSRMKKILALRKKKVNSPERESLGQPWSPFDEIQKTKKTERVQSEMSEKPSRVRDWTDSTKRRRVQFSVAKQQHYSEYLETQKIKYLKTTIAKQIANSAIEKKLFLERLI